jgi:hypothetical protein
MTKEQENLKFWNSVRKTDPDQTKPIQGRGYSGTSVSPLYMISKVTSKWGPIGLDWGFDEVEHKILDGLWFSKVRLWYSRSLFRDGEEGIAEIYQWGGTEYKGLRASGKPFQDDEAAKKSITDGLMKALSYLGFAADVHLGLHDDSKYVNGLRQEKQARKNGQGQSPVPEQQNQSHPQSSQPSPQPTHNPATQQGQAQYSAPGNVLESLPELHGVSYHRTIYGGKEFIEARGETRGKGEFLKASGFRWAQNHKKWLCQAQ